MNIRERDHYGNGRERDNYGNGRERDNYGNGRERDNYGNGRERDNYGNGRERDNYGHGWENDYGDNWEGKTFHSGANSTVGKSPAMWLMNTYGLSVPFLKSLGIHGRLGKKVFVANIDFYVDSKMLEDAFKLAGNVINVDLFMQDGKSRGMGVVEYSHPFEAVQAISMFNDQTYYDRKLKVRIFYTNEKERNKMDVRLPQGMKKIGRGLGANGSPLTEISSLPDTMVFMQRETGKNMSDLYLQEKINDSTRRANFSHGYREIQERDYYNSLASSGEAMEEGDVHSRLSHQHNNLPTVHINKLPLSWTWQNLQDLCKTFGEIMHVKMLNGGRGRVTFELVTSARKAVAALSHTIIGEKSLEAKII